MAAPLPPAAPATDATGALAAAVGDALRPVVRELVDAFGSTLRVRRGTSARNADATRRTTWADADPARVACVLSQIDAAHAQRVYGAHDAATFEGVVSSLDAVAIDDVVLVEAGPFAGEWLRVTTFGVGVGMVGLRLVGFQRTSDRAGLPTAAAP